MITLPEIDNLWNFADPEGTEAKFRQALEEVSPQDEAHRAELLTQISRTYSLRNMFDEAHAQLDEVAEMLPRVGDYVETRYLLERGRTFNSSEQKEKAKQLFLRAVDTGKVAGDDYLVIDAMHMMGIVEEPEAAIEWQKLGLQVVEETNSDKARQWTGALSNNLGWAYHDKGEFETALAYFEQGLAYREEADKEPALRIAKWAVARCKRSLGHAEEALQEQLAILEEHFPEYDPTKQALGTIDGAGHIAEEIGECYLALGRAEPAKPYFKAAHELLRKDDRLAKNEPERIARLKELSD
ncbi:MAG: tetratricopeptide repeat-containing protein [Armatimonadetes bacterium]|nr:tetratricopeptide repeat-containing protein [Armatimonadota bacterium]